jgi:hypothetical protein
MREYACAYLARLSSESVPHATPMKSKRAGALAQQDEVRRECGAVSLHPFVRSDSQIAS